MIAPQSLATAAHGISFRVPAFHVLFGTHPAASQLPRHTHDTPTICCVVQGRFLEHYSGRIVDCDERMVKVTPAGDPHWNRFENVLTRGVRIDVTRSAFADVASVNRLLDERRFFRAHAFNGWTRRLVDELTAPDDSARLAVEALLLELLARLARQADRRSATRPRWLSHAIQQVHDCFREPLTLSGVAAAAGVHPTTLARAFRREFGCSIGERVRELRIAAAARELATSDAALSDIALRAGFYDQAHFSNTFRRLRQVTPAQYRARFRTGAGS